MAPPTVAVDLRALVGDPTGIGVHTRALLAELAPRRRRRFVGMSHAAVDDPAALEALGVELEVHPTALGVMWQQLRLPRRLRRGDVDLLWSPLQILPWSLPVPGVVTVHDLTALLYPEAHRSKVRWSILPFIRRTLETATRVVAISTATADDLRFHFPQCSAQLRVVPNGVERRFVPGTPEAIAATRQRLGCQAGYVLYVGTLEPRKNVGQLLEAWEHLRAADAGLPPLLVAGGVGWHSRGLVERLDRLEAAGQPVRRLGRLSDEELLAVLQAATVFVYPSLYEGFGLPPLEALACGVPTIVTRTSSLPEVVGEAAAMVEPGDVPGLASALRRLLDDHGLAAELSRRGPEQAARFPWWRSADLLDEVFGEALAE